jgi:N-carbamoyl-D-amino-acid hydrolase
MWHIVTVGAAQLGPIVLGYTPVHNPAAPEHDLPGNFHAPSGETVAMCTTLEDELCVGRCDLDLTRSYKETVFNFARHRRPEHYRLIVDRTGAEPPA